jgi:hypothetical protein
VLSLRRTALVAISRPVRLGHANRDRNSFNFHSEIDDSTTGTTTGSRRPINLDAEQGLIGPEYGPFQKSSFANKTIWFVGSRRSSSL